MKYNLIIGIILMVLSYMIGLELSKKYSKRCVFFSDFEEFNQLLISEISFTKSSIPEILRKNKSKNSPFYLMMVDRFINKSYNFTKLSYLNDKEWNYFKNYVDNVGKVNGEMSLDFAKGVKERLSSLTKEARLDESKKKPLIIKVSFMVGLILLIAFL